MVNIFNLRSISWLIFFQWYCCHNVYECQQIAKANQWKNVAQVYAGQLFPVNGGRLVECQMVNVLFFSWVSLSLSLTPIFISEYIFQGQSMQDLAGCHKSMSLNLWFAHKTCGQGTWTPHGNATRNSFSKQKHENFFPMGPRELIEA